MSFKLAAPIEAVASSDEPQVQFALKITNSSDFTICIASMKDGQWKKGLVPDYKVDVKTAPITVTATALDKTAIAGVHLKQGRSYESAAFQLRVQPNPGVADGTTGTFYFTFGLVDGTKHPVNPGHISYTEIPINFTVRSRGLPVLLSLPATYSSKQGVYPW